MNSSAFEQFLEQLARYPSMWDCLELKAVGATKGESLFLLALSCTLSVALHPSREVLLETPELIMVKEIKPLTELRSVLNGLTSGSVLISDRPFVADGFTAFECRMWGGGGQGWVDTTYPYVLLYSTGKSVRELVDDSAIYRSLEQWGYRYLWDVSQEKVGFPVGGAHVSHIRFIAPIYLEANAAFVDNHLRIVLKCSPSLKTEDLSAGYEITLNYLGNRQVQRGKLDFLDASRLEDAVSFTLVKELDLLPQAESVFIWLFHSTQKDPLYALRVLKPTTAKTNPVWGAMNVVLSKREGGQILYAEELLRRSLGLTAKGTDSGRFESAVHNLFGCLGYSCIFTGREWGTEGIDTLAFGPGLDDKVLAVSVTTSNNIAEKIRTMLLQLENLKRGIGNIAVIPVICASITSDCVLHSDWVNLKAHNISLLLLPQLQQILDDILRLPLPEVRRKWESMLGDMETLHGKHDEGA
ncbi:MAG: hypothetical protein AB1597_04825 [Chloroflexota bacterium]